jgi:hypothetical protein
MTTVAMAVPVSIAAWTRSARERELASIAECKECDERLTIIALPPIKCALPDEVIEDEAEDKPQGVLG